MYTIVEVISQVAKESKINEGRIKVSQILSEQNQLTIVMLLKQLVEYKTNARDITSNKKSTLDLENNLLELY